MHPLQPLNVKCFSSVAYHYGKGVEFSGCHAIHGISKHEFLKIYLEAHTRRLFLINIVSVYQQAGLILFNLNQVLRQLPSQPKTPKPSQMQSCPPHLKTTSQLLKTPTSIQQVELDLFKICQENVFGYLLQSTFSYICIDKLGRAAGAAVAENITLK